MSLPSSSASRRWFSSLRWLGGWVGWWTTLSFLLGAASAQDLRPHKHPLTAYLDLRPAAADAPAQNTPHWIEALEFTPGAQPSVAEATDSDATAVPTRHRERSVFRIRLRRPDANGSELLQARVFFEDLSSGERPQVTVWNELGERLMAPVTLGQNLGLPSSETLTLPMHEADYLEIEANRDGSQVRGVFLSWLEPAEIFQPSDFRTKETVQQPFHILPALRSHKNDSSLYGVVNATLQGKTPLVLKPGEKASVDLQFELERVPLLAVITYEVLGAAVDAPPAVAVNGRAQGDSTFDLPDLADPGFQGESRETETRMAFRYTGWLHAQKIIPGEALVAGLNTLRLGLSNGTDAIAIRAVSIQLKYDWEKFDYVLAPASPATP